MRHVGFRYLLVGQQGVTGSKLRVTRDQDRWHHRGLHSLVMVGVDADLHLLAGEGILAHLQGLEFMVRL